MDEPQKRIISQDFREIEATVSRMQSARVLVVGDIMLDRFVNGEVTRISPESPVPVLSIRSTDTMLGGAGNVVANLASLGAQCAIAGLVGEDLNGREVLRMLEGSGVDIRAVLHCPDRPTTVKTRYLAAHQQLLRADEEANFAPENSLSDRLFERIRDMIRDLDAIVLSDYGKGVLIPSFCRKLIDLAGQHDIPVLVDPKGTDYTKYRGARAITPNRKELSEATGGMPVFTDDEVEAACRVLMETSGVRSIVATRSSQGMSYVTSKSAEHLRTRALEVFDVSGAGDTVIATLAATVASGGTMTESVILANLAGGVVVSKVGTARIRPEELLKAVDEQAFQGQRKFSRLARYCFPEEANEHVNRWRARGLRVGFTNGCFDILHAGHVAYLDEARGRCDRLIVGLNTDESIRRLKGKDRPINALDIRAGVLGALASVDMVVPFGDDPLDDDTPLRLLETFRPDLLVKGADYTEDRVVGADFVKSYGGEIYLAQIEEGHSTTRLIERMRSLQTPKGEKK